MRDIRVTDASVANPVLYPPPIGERGKIGKCGVCAFIWPKASLVTEDGVEKCPNHASGRYATVLAQAEADAAAKAAAFVLEPQLSQIALNETELGCATKLTDGSGVRVSEGAPLNLTKTVAGTLRLIGIEFSSSDTITGPSNMTVTVSARTATLTTLTLTAGVAMAAGDYSLVLNSQTFRNVLRVR